ncbi:MAG: hypothetical protein KIT56_09735 [Gammaproteobacteria bacterium]|nr:hypothetical protein [Gammaproteobacteria bacterium]
MQKIRKIKRQNDYYAKKTIHHLPANMPKELISSFEVLWQTAMEHAQNQLAEHKKVSDKIQHYLFRKFQLKSQFLRPSVNGSL